ASARARAIARKAGSNSSGTCASTICSSTPSVRAASWTILTEGTYALNPKPFSWIDHLIRPGQQRGRDREAERPSGLQVDDELEFGWPLDREVAGFGTPEDLID